MPEARSTTPVKTATLLLPARSAHRTSVLLDVLELVKRHARSDANIHGIVGPGPSAHCGDRMTPVDRGGRPPLIQGFIAFGEPLDIGHSVRTALDAQSPAGERIAWVGRQDGFAVYPSRTATVRFAQSVVLRLFRWGGAVQMPLV